VHRARCRVRDQGCAAALAVLLLAARAARRSHGDLPDVVPARRTTIHVPAEGGQSRRLSSQPRARRADVQPRSRGHHRGQNIGGQMSALRKMLAVQLAGNALLLWLAYEWLDLAESNGLPLTLGALDALAILALFCWLHGATVVLFRARAEERRLNAAFKAALRRVPLLVGAAIVAIAIYGALAWLPGVVKLRKPAMFNGTLWVIR